MRPIKLQWPPRLCTTPRWLQTTNAKRSQGPDDQNNNMQTVPTAWCNWITSPALPTLPALAPTLPCSHSRIILALADRHSGLCHHKTTVSRSCGSAQTLCHITAFCSNQEKQKVPATAQAYHPHRHVPALRRAHRRTPHQPSNDIACCRAATTCKATDRRKQPHSLLRCSLTLTCYTQRKRATRRSGHMCTLFRG